MIHNPFNNAKFAVSMVAFFLLVIALFYNASYKIAGRFANNIAASSTSLAQADSMRSPIVSHPVEDFETPEIVPENPCTADVSRDGMVDNFDIETIIENWHGPADSTYDLTFDGAIDSNDLAYVFDNWGACQGEQL